MSSSQAIVMIETRTGLRLVATRASCLLREDGAPPSRTDTRLQPSSLGTTRPGARSQSRPAASEKIEAALGGLLVQAEIERHVVSDSARISLRLSNRSAGPAQVERVALTFELPSDPATDWAFLKNGWASWSMTGVAAVEAGGDAAFPSGSWLRGMHHAVGERSPGRDGWHESHTVVAAAAGPVALVAGFLETGRQFGLVNLRRKPGGALEIELESVIERSLAAGETLELEEAWLALGDEPHRLLETFATRWGHGAGARTEAPFQAGWCSWYHYFHDITEDALLHNLEALAERRDEFPISLVQLDDGYQHAIGDWLETNAKFPSGLGFVAERIRDAGFEAGLWTAPFSAVRHSHLLSDHPDWVLHGDEGEWLRGTLIPQWSDEGWCYSLDPSHPGLLAHLESVYRALADMGFTYQKLDFLYMGAMRGLAHDPSMTRAERLARGLEAVRSGAGEDAFLLGCGCPLGPAVGRVDGMRIGPDVAPYWSVKTEGAIPGIEPALPATDSAIRSITTRLWMHRRLWLNDPDCLMLRRRETELSEAETDTLAHAIAASGGMVVFSDDVTLLEEEEGEETRGDEREEARGLRKIIEIAHAVDDAAAWGGARLIDMLSLDVARQRAPTTLEASTGQDIVRADLNLADMDLSTSVGEHLAAHASRLTRGSAEPEIAVFCDFDGTFVVQDVGSGIARKYLADTREALRLRYDVGELDAWTYALELFGGFALPEADRAAFLESIDLDPGAVELLETCRRRAWPFEILSDGFDANITKLRNRFGLDFDFRANALHVDSHGWQLEPGGRNPACACGTGLCKRAVLEDFRRRHPSTLLVHVGNGMISDLCAALVADRVFAKDTLAPALDRAGRSHEKFETLADVSAALIGLLGAARESR